MQRYLRRCITPELDSDLFDFILEGHRKVELYDPKDALASGEGASIEDELESSLVRGQGWAHGGTSTSINPEEQWY
jgi:hypothetical protein